MNGKSKIKSQRRTKAVEEQESTAALLKRNFLTGEEELIEYGAMGSSSRCGIASCYKSDFSTLQQLG